MSKMDTDLTSAVASSSDASILRKEAELKAKREHAEKLLREKQAIVERAQRRKSLEKEEKRVNELLERALQYDVNTELQKLNLSARIVESMTLRLIQGVDGVVAGFGVDVGLELLDLINEAWTVKDDDTVDAAECGETIGTLGFALYRAIRAFQRADTFITVDQDPELVAECA